MNVGMNLLLWTDHPAAEQHEELFHQIRAWGFDGVEIPIDPLSRDEAKGLSTCLDELQLQRTTISALDAATADPSSPDPQLRRAAVEQLKRSVENTRVAGADIMCGPLFQGLGKFTGAAPRLDEWKHAVECLREVGEFARMLNVKIALEALNRFEMYMVNTVAEGARFVRDVGLDNVGLLVDTHHGNIEEQHVAKAWEEVAEHIIHVHISENHRGVPGSGHAVPGEIFDVLKLISYQGWLTIEAFSQQVPGLIPRLHLWRAYSAHPDDPARLGIEFIRKHLQA
jgi:D-psicose/D-tagatose/L-ribulose 3-epimerase